MIYSIKVTNHLGESLDLVLREPEKSGLAVTGITGLGPTKSTINVTDLVTKDGGLFNSAHMDKRNIVLSLRCYATNKLSIEDCRQVSYKYFQVKNKVRLEFKTDNRDCYIDGYVESNEPEIFSEEESLQVSIICPDPFFYSMETDDNEQRFEGAKRLFEFPFSNESLTENKITFSYLQHYPAQAIYYDGEYQTGFEIIIHAVGTVYNPTIINLSTGDQMTIKTDVVKKITGDTIRNGDTVTINTVTGKKSVTLTRDGVDYNIISALGSQAVWFKLQKGENLFTYESEFGAVDINILYKWSVGYEGI